jgi:hypothetical protein
MNISELSRKAWDEPTNFGWATDVEFDGQNLDRCADLVADFFRDLL